MVSMDTPEAVTALGDAYRAIGDLAGELSEADFLRPSGCLGWTVSDVLCHVLGDARRGLVALATPADTEPDVDFVSYWTPWRPGGDDDLVRARGFRAVSATVSARGGPAGLVEAWQETAPAVVRLAGLAPYPVVATQGHALTVADFACTLAVEATVHHLDMIAWLPAAPGPAALPDPAATGLALVRRTLDGLLGVNPATGWDDTAYALKGTGRKELTPQDRAILAGLADRFPLFG
ncbi:MAG TPA: maleylpyruvate isomerase N-terminal domain-containing protein [Streptosporangiaceae bacterium]|jgi:uncharacterized protein (TIGR03083 family)